MFAAGLITLFQESRVTQKILIASSRSLTRFRVQAKSKYARLTVKSYRTLKVQYGWILYVFDMPQFLRFMQFLFDKVIIFMLVVCEK